MGEKKEQKMKPINQVFLNGETIKEIIFINVMGGEKMIWAFESGRVLVMPVYRECPVQEGSVEDIKEDFPLFIQEVQKQIDLSVTEGNKVIEQIRRLKDGSSS